MGDGGLGARQEPVKQFLQIALGILSAIGGFVDIGDLVFNTQAGATFGFQLLWVVVVGVIGIIVYSEMCGRVAAVSKRPVFDLVRERVGFSAGLGTLVASEVVNLLTCAAEIGGVAIALQLLSGLPYRSRRTRSTSTRRERSRTAGARRTCASTRSPRSSATGSAHSFRSR